MSIRRSILLASFIPLAACDAQVDADDQGIALATLQGTVANTRTQPTATADVVVLWRNRVAPSMISGDVVPVEGNFPAEFTLSLYEPPPADMMNAFDQTLSPFGPAPCDADLACETKFGVAYLMAALPGQTDFRWPAPQPLGMDLDHLLVYVPEDVPAGSLVSKLLHSAPAAGFHVYGVQQLTREQLDERGRCSDTLTDSGAHEPLIQDMYDHCGGLLEVDDIVPLPQDLATSLQITLVDDLSMAEPPVW